LGLAGNPGWTMGRFELFAGAAIELLAGMPEVMLPLCEAVLTAPFRQKPGLTRFLPATLLADGASIEPVGWKGSGDVMALSRANCFLVSDPARAEYAAGERIRVLLV